MKRQPVETPGFRRTPGERGAPVRRGAEDECECAVGLDVKGSDRLAWWRPDPVEESMAAQVEDIDGVSAPPGQVAAGKRHVAAGHAKLLEDGSRAVVHRHALGG